MIILNVLIFIVAILGVTKSADWFLGSAETVGKYFKLPSFIMGVILVGFGTSLPELTTSLAAVANGESGIAIGNILGSNIANVLIVIGLATIAVGTIRFKKDLIDIDLPYLVAITFFFALLVIDGSLSRFDGALLILGFIGYMTYSIFYRDHEDYHSGLVRSLRTILFSKVLGVEDPQVVKPTIRTWVVLVVSLVGLAILSKVAVDSLLFIVEDIGIAVGVVSFFALAIGTSLPEIVVSIKALKKGDGDMVLGNIVGSCMFNILLIGGIASLLAPQSLGMPQGYWMIAGLLISAVLLVVSGVTRRMHMWEGAAFLLVYTALALQII